MKASEASLITGYSQGRISILQKDATFAALVRDYSDEAKATFADLAQRMSGLSLDAIEILHERLHANPETLSIPVLLDVVKTLADRTGHGPGQEVHLKVDRDFIDRPPRESAEEVEVAPGARTRGPRSGMHGSRSGSGSQGNQPESCSRCRNLGAMSLRRALLRPRGPHNQGLSEAISADWCDKLFYGGAAGGGEE